MMLSKNTVQYIFATARMIPDVDRDEYFARVAQLLRGTPAEFDDVNRACLDARNYVLGGAE
ncbi:MAG: hypothetical protein RO009_15730 [Pseudorhodoplanes sp.]|jgi:hypothetical protein|nr:hypothetical protein [Pseudorhodoplanes sp.]